MSYYKSATLHTRTGGICKIRIGSKIGVYTVHTIMSFDLFGVNETVIGLRFANDTYRWYFSDALIMDLFDRAIQPPASIARYSTICLADKWSE